MTTAPIQPAPQPLPVPRVPPFFQHVRRQLPDYAFGTILDVGANIGQSCTAFALAAPEAAVIHAFEPIGPTYGVLAANVAGNPRIRVHNLALGASPGEIAMTATAYSTNNRVVADRPRGRNLARVAVTTGDLFCREQGIEAISYLKIDTEGHDLDVLTGFAATLPRVDFVQVEAAMNPYNTLHAPFRALEDVLRAAGFQLFQIYDQAFQGRLPVLRRSNPVFVHDRVLDAARAAAG
jgi:FkbM family methyltransferase